MDVQEKLARLEERIEELRVSLGHWAGMPRTNLAELDPASWPKHAMNFSDCSRPFRHAKGSHQEALVDEVKLV